MSTKKPDRPQPNVYLIDDDQVITFLLVDLVESVGLPYAVFNDAPSFLKQDLSSLAGCIVTDVRMPGMSGLELQDELRHQGIDLPIIFISSYAEVASVVRAMRGGALDFFQKPFSTQRLLDRIQDGLRIDRARAEIQARSREIGERMALLTPREREVLEGVFEGKLTKTIAHELGISQRTAETYRHLIMQKLQAGSIAELVRLTMEFMPGKS
ncbi:response regulator [Sulfuritalea sp.]|uniref:response regulator transcription factor n=1 Tax=Sulfuritalea sp. TaxID=2480090 RepID=UPI001AC3643C|nr:response regulator [Sulfuritalea sp.]MBN8473726.1 response regulator transcription factor [Sulfuritalea sp.]